MSRHEDGTFEAEQLEADVELLLRQAWNGRGDVDTKAIEERLASLTGWVSSEPYRQHLREAIAGFDQKA
jgi:hypothetical protein